MHEASCNVSVFLIGPCILAIQGSSYPPANFSEYAPFTFCPSFGEGDELGNLYGGDSILKTRAHVGSSERVRKVLRRAMAGLPISASYTTTATCIH